MTTSKSTIWAAALAALVVSVTALLAWPPSSWWPGAESSAVSGGGAPLAEEKLQLVTQSGVHELLVEVARTSDQQAKGLMFRASLPDDRGMLFPHEPPREVTMWMRNTYIPLDMVFLTGDGTVHRIEARTEPLSEKVISSRGDVSAVLEIAGGAAERLGLKPGDRVLHPLFKAR